MRLAILLTVITLSIYSTNSKRSRSSRNTTWKIVSINRDGQVVNNYSRFPLFYIGSVSSLKIESENLCNLSKSFGIPMLCCITFFTTPIDLKNPTVIGLNHFDDLLLKHLSLSSKPCFPTEELGESFSVLNGSKICQGLTCYNKLRFPKICRELCRECDKPCRHSYLSKLPFGW